MRYANGFISSLFLTLMLSCSGNRSSSPGSSSLDSVSGITVESTIKYCDLDSVKVYLSLFEERVADLKQQIQQATPEQVDVIFAQLKEADKEAPHFLFEELYDYSFRSDLTERSAAWGTPTATDSLALARLKPVGIILDDVGEGCVELKLSQYYYYNLFWRYMTPCSRDYLKIWSDHNVRYADDEALRISVDTLYTWALSWEEYIKKYPQTPWLDQVKSDYQLCLTDILFCRYSNTPTFDGHWDKEEDKFIIERINEQNLVEIEKLKRSGQGTHSHAIVSEYTRILSMKDNYYTNELEERIREMCDWM